MAVWSEEQRWAYVRERGYEILDAVPDGWYVMDTSVEPKPHGLIWVGCGSRFDGTHRKALVRRSA